MTIEEKAKELFRKDVISGEPARKVVCAGFGIEYKRPTWSRLSKDIKDIWRLQAQRELEREASSK